MPVVSRTSALTCAIVATVDKEHTYVISTRVSVEDRATNVPLAMRRKGLNVRNALQVMNQIQQVAIGFAILIGDLYDETKIGCDELGCSLLWTWQIPVSQWFSPKLNSVGRQVRKLGTSTS